MKKQLLALAITAIATSGAFAQATDTLAKLKDSGKISLGVRDSSALSFTLGNGKYVGFHTEMAERIVDDLNKATGKTLAITYTPVTSQNRIPLVQNGTVDLECGSTTTNGWTGDGTTNGNGPGRSTMVVNFFTNKLWFRIFYNVY